MTPEPRQDPPPERRWAETPWGAPVVPSGGDGETTPWTWVSRSAGVIAGLACVAIYFQVFGRPTDGEYGGLMPFLGYLLAVLTFVAVAVMWVIVARPQWKDERALPLITAILLPVIPHVWWIAIGVTTALWVLADPRSIR
jgi:hypothetical protein